MTTEKCWAKIGPVTVRLSGGDSYEFSSLEHALTWPGARRATYLDELPFADDVSAFHAACCGELRYHRPRDVTRILFLDELGLRIPAWKVSEVAALIGDPRPSFVWPRARRCYDPGKFRVGPVPFTGKSGGYRYFRRMKTTQERRMFLAAAGDADYIEAGGRLRARRSERNLVNAWDDVTRQAPSRNWKEYRRTRWKA